MPVIARDTVASDHLVYAWPFPIGPEDYEVACADDELVVMCPAWLVGDRLGPGRHRWRTPDPSRPVHAYFVLTAPVEVSFDMITQFLIPTTGQAVRLRATGSLQVRCMDPALLVAQFVGLPFDSVNEGVLRSVSRSIERMLARLLTRRVVMAGTPAAVTDPAMLSNIVEELVAYNPTAGAVFGVELVRFGHLQIAADDGSRPWQHMTNGVPHAEAPLVDTARAAQSAAPQVIDRESQPTAQMHSQLPPPPIPVTPLGRGKGATAPPPIPAAAKRNPGPPMATASGEITQKPRTPATTLQTPVVPPPPGVPPSAPSFAAGSRPPTPAAAAPSGPAGRRAGSVEVQSTDEPTQPGIDIIRTPLPGSLHAVSGEIGAPRPPAAPPAPQAPAHAPAPAPKSPGPPQSSVSGEIGGPKLAQGTPAPKVRAQSEPQESRGSIMGIGVSHIGSSEVASGEITKKIAPGGRVLVPGPNGLMQSATVRQLLQGYYELEVGGSGETIWVPVNGVVPE